jgi:hypothetical protein
MYYNARWYDPYLNHFTQPDSIVPDPYNPQDWDRYSYVRNNPLRYTDPSGHKVCWEGSTPGHCLDATGSIKKEIKDTYGVTLSDGGATHPHFKDSHGRAWDLKNALLALLGLSRMNGGLPGNLKGIIGSATFTLNSHPEGGYMGWTVGRTVDFYNNTTIPLQNLYHEFGHVLNNLPGRDNAFSDALDNLHDPSFITDANVLDKSALKSQIVNDPYRGPHVGAIQALLKTRTDPKEQWADIFANYAAGNIDLSKPSGPGLDMYNFITSELYTAPAGAPLAIPK